MALVPQVQAYGVWGRGAEDAAQFLLGTGPGRRLLHQADRTAQARVRRTLTDRLRDHEAADGTVRLRSTSWAGHGGAPGQSVGRALTLALSVRRAADTDRVAAAALLPAGLGAAVRRLPPRPGRLWDLYAGVSPISAGRADVRGTGAAARGPYLR